jgi:hypothetical protein
MTASFENFCLASGIEALADGKRRANGVRPATRARQEAKGASLGQDERQDWLSQRQGGD